MKVFKDIVSGDEMFSDIHRMTETPCLYVVECKMTKQSSGFDDNLLGGANKSAEEGAVEESYEAGSVSGVDIVLNNRLVEMPIDKKGYGAYIKGYMKEIKSRLEEDKSDRVADFTKNAPVEIKKILGEFKEYQFFSGESMNPEGMLALMKWEDEGTRPVMYFFKDGLLEEKL